MLDTTTDWRENGSDVELFEFGLSLGNPMELPPSVLRVANVLSEIVEVLDRDAKNALHRAGLSVSQAKVLSAIASERETRLTELARDLAMSKSTVSSCLETLERQDLITRTRQREDRRAYPVRLTERGRVVARRMRRAQDKALVQAANTLTPYQRKTLASALDALLETLERIEKGHPE